MRQWLKGNFSGHKEHCGQWMALCSQEFGVDMAISTCEADAEILHMLGSDDRVEVALRHLSVFSTRKRTRGRVGAAMMRLQLQCHWGLAETLFQNGR